MGIVPQRYEKPRDPLRVGANPVAKELGYAAGQLGYAQIIADQGGIVAPTDIIGLSTNIIVGANRRIKITAHAITFNTSAGVVDAIYIMEGGTILQRSLIISGGVTTEESLESTYVTTPSAGLHTYKIRGDRSGGTLTVRGSANAPAFILVEDIGAA